MFFSKRNLLNIKKKGKNFYLKSEKEEINLNQVSQKCKQKRSATKEYRKISR